MAAPHLRLGARRLPAADQEGWCAVSATDSWTVRSSFGGSRTTRDGRVHCTKTVELIWTGDNKAYHILTGPTAEESMREFADKLNREKAPPSEMKKCKADGCHIPKDGGNDQMFLSLQMRPTDTAP